jgi:SAM-dependent methyltransferase
MVRGSVASRRRAEGLTWLIGLGARQPLNVARGRVDAWLRNRRGHSGQGIAPADRAALRATNPELVALHQRYAGLQDLIGAAPFWRPGYIDEQDLLYFRGDNCYVWQFQANNTPEKYALTYLYLRTIDTLGLFDVLTETGDYGVFTFPTGEIDKDGNSNVVSRDLLDSVCELLFLERALQISRRPGLKVLDIGAGYGRLAYRAVTALSNVDTYFCIDAIPESTFVSRYYLSEKAADRTRVIAFDAQEDLVPGTIDLAVSIHSFSECSIEAVDYWLSRCAELKIEYLFIVPNVSGESGGKAVRLMNGTDIRPLLAQRGYQLCHTEPKYRNQQVQKYGVSPKWYYLFRAA